jgi:multidrug efflux pump subunit AcrB
MNGLIAWFARNDVAANLLMLIIVVAGLYSLSNKIPVDLFPEFEVNTVQVNTILPGASPQEVEKGLTIKIEEAIEDIPGIREMSSRSNEGRSSVTVEVEDGFDVKEILDEMKSRVDAINNLPVDAERPLVTVPLRKRDAIGVVMYGDYDGLTLRRLAEDVRDEIASLPEVSQVSVDNSLRFEISIEIPEWSLRKYDLTLEQVSAALRRNSTDISAGNLKTEGGDIFIRSIGQAYSASDFSKLPILTDKDGTLIRLGDIAVLRDEFEETPLRTRFNGIPAIEVEVFRVGDQSIIDVTDAVKNYIEEKQEALPEGVSMTYWRDRSKSIKARLATLTRSAWQGALLVILLLALFLRPAVALWVCIGIPMSFMGAFILMPIFGISLNLMSLFAFILVLGIVVDDAIVTGENVYDHMQRGTDPLTAAIKGTQEVAVPVTFGILTTVAAFIPLALLEGRGSWYQSIPYVIVPVLLFSLIESKLVLPAHLKHIKPRIGTPSPFTRIQMAISTSLETFISKVYQPALILALRWRYATLAIMLSSLFIVIGALASGQTKFVFFPRVQSEVATATLTMPAGTAFESTDRIVAHMTKQAQLLQAKYIDPVTGESIIKNIYSISGGRNSTTGRVRVETIPPEDRNLEIGTQQLVAQWRKMVGQVAGAEQLNYRAEIGWSRPAIKIELRGKNANDLAELGEIFKSKLGEFSAVSDIEDSMSDGKEELQLKLKPEATLLGLNLNMVARQVRQAVYGFEVQRIQRGREEVRVMVRYPIGDRQSIETLEQMMIKVGARQEVPLWQIADIVPGLSPSTILRINRQRTLSITADFDKEQGNLSSVQKELEVFLQQSMSGYPGMNYEMAGEARDQKESSNELKFGMYGLLLVIYILLAIPFKSYFQPLVVMMVIPFGIVGAVIGHWIMGMNLTLLSLMGVLALSGVVVNDSLVLVDFINKKRAEGVVLFDAVYAAGGRRFRPVILTSLTTFVGLMPLLFEKSTQAQFLIPMAVSLGFGILFATIITLFLVPINYLIMEDIKRYGVRYKNDMGWLIGKGFKKIK